MRGFQAGGSGCEISGTFRAFVSVTVGHVVTGVQLPSFQSISSYAALIGITIIWNFPQTHVKCIMKSPV